MFSPDRFIACPDCDHEISDCRCPKCCPCGEPVYGAATECAFCFAELSAATIADDLNDCAVAS